MTHVMCDEFGRIEVDECYTLAQRDLKYTLLHLRARAVRSTISSMMIKFDEKYGIKSVPVFGYLAVSIGSEIDDHPGMLLIADHARRGTELLECWTSNGDIRSHRRGLLYFCLPGFAVDKMNRTQLINHIRELTQKMEADRMTIVEMQSAVLESEALRDQVARLQRRLEVQVRVFCRAGRADEVPPPSP